MFLGPLEAELMEIAWERSEVTVKRARQLLRDSTSAYTTISTVLNRLVEKGLLTKSRDRNRSLYAPTQPRSDFILSQVQLAVSSLRKSFPAEFKQALKD